MISTTTAAPPSCYGILANMTCTELVTGLGCNEYRSQWLQTIEDVGTGEQCLTDPYEIELLFNGGDCSTSWTASGGGDDLDIIDCRDYNQGPPPTTSDGTSSFVLIESVDIPGLIFFDDLVAVGETITIPNNYFVPFDGEIDISIYEAGATDTAEEWTGVLLQKVRVPFDCKTGNIGPLDRYGAMQLVGFSSVEQGQQSFFANHSSLLTMKMELEIINAIDQPFRLHSLSAGTTTPPYFFNFTDNLPNKGGYLLLPDERLVLDVHGDIDMAATNDTFSVLMNWEATKLGAGAGCKGHKILDFAFHESNPPTSITDSSSDNNNLKDDGAPTTVAMKKAGGVPDEANKKKGPDYNPDLVNP